MGDTPDGGTPDAVVDSGWDVGTNVDVAVDNDEGGPGDGGVEGPADDGGSDTPPDLSLDGTPDRSDVTPPGCNISLYFVMTSPSASLLQDTAGIWQLCGDATNLPADIQWVLGDATTIQLDGVNWWRLGPGQLSHGNQPAAGTYFRVLEGNGNVLQFVDANVSTGGGATLAVDFFPSVGVLELASCDGANTCNDPSARLVPPAH